MAAKSPTFDNDLLKLIFQATGIANIADNTATAPLTSLYVSLHTADPSATAGYTQATSEVAYTGFARVAVARSSTGFTVTNNSVSPAAAISFTAGPSGMTAQTATYFSVGVASSGATKVLYSGPISPSIAISAGVTPQLGTATAVTES